MGEAVLSLIVASRKEGCKKEGSHSETNTRLNFNTFLRHKNPGYRTFNNFLYNPNGGECMDTITVDDESGVRQV